MHLGGGGSVESRKAEGEVIGPRAPVPLIQELQQRCEMLEAQLQGRPVQNVNNDKFGAVCGPNNAVGGPGAAASGGLVAPGSQIFLSPSHPEGGEGGRAFPRERAPVPPCPRILPH